MLSPIILNSSPKTQLLKNGLRLILLLGTVMVVNEEGLLEPSQQPYDKKVAGVISGE